MEAEFEEIDKAGTWGQLFQQIRQECINYDYTYKEAKKLENKILNRYRDVSPYDHSRVKLISGTCDYINASLLKVPAAHRAYILAQGPLPHTTGHFWQMVWEQKSKAVLMLNKVIEKNQVKCHQYWPLGKLHDGEDEMILKDVSLKIEYLTEKETPHYTVRELKLTDLMSSDSRIVQHFHYTTWPDFGVPQSPAAFLHFLLAVRNAGVLDENVGPPIVHCSAGIGRSGTFCLVDTCLVLIDQKKDMNSVNIKEILLEMRKYRMGLIQTPDQLRFSYLAIIEGAKNILHGGFTERILMNEENHRVTEEINSNMKGEEKDHRPPPLPPRKIKEPEEHSYELSAGSDAKQYLPTTYQNLQNSTETSISDAELRKRARCDNNVKSVEKIEKTKRQQGYEIWQKPRSYFIPLSIGFGLLIILVYKFYYKNQKA